MSGKKIIEFILEKKFNQAKSLIHETMAQKIGLILEEQLQQTGSNLLETATDPVGEEDEDVNNDGKTNEQDEYLMKRRKAIANKGT
jgi:hypothetical protein